MSSSLLSFPRLPLQILKDPNLETAAVGSMSGRDDRARAMSGQRNVLHGRRPLKLLAGVRRILDRDVGRYRGGGPDGDAFSLVATGASQASNILGGFRPGAERGSHHTGRRSRLYEWPSYCSENPRSPDVTSLCDPSRVNAAGSARRRREL